MPDTLTARLQDQFDAELETRADFTIDQPLERYRAVDHSVWQQLHVRQTELLKGRACEAFLEGVARLGLPSSHVPSFDALNEKLARATGWSVVAVPGLVPEPVFFEHLAHRRLPVTWWMRRPDQLDYLQEPDLFHDLFGHVPLLMHPVFADYMQAYGQTALAAGNAGALPLLARLYWYTVEFGLIRDASGSHGMKIYGAGIVSSKSEALYSLESDAPNRIGFDLERVMQTRYRIDTFQKSYFVIDDFNQLFELARTDLAPLLAKLADATPHPAGTILATDRIITGGSGAGWTAGGDV
ncbi:phenylalanine 4-monooxygenase [Paraburkholderia phosphatilytica]|uniref:phenylalanine 4-monooxygenase n=1 Tax=Paraburkholderia phosphatilytica TaxID=2282883 RepID=UPI000E5166AA|nr:phenylalanine 4-monooxygenase [Paraburkholderia phosphatilytica]